MSYKLYWKSQSSHASQDEQHAKLEDAIRELKVALTGLYAHSGGNAGIINRFFPCFYSTHMHFVFRLPESPFP